MLSTKHHLYMSKTQHHFSWHAESRPPGAVPGARRHSPPCGPRLGRCFLVGFEALEYHGILMGYYPLVMTNIALEDGPVEIVDFASYNMVDLSIAMLVYQRE